MEPSTDLPGLITPSPTQPAKGSRSFSIKRCQTEFGFKYEPKFPASSKWATTVTHKFPEAPLKQLREITNQTSSPCTVGPNSYFPAPQRTSTWKRTPSPSFCRQKRFHEVTDVSFSASNTLHYSSVGLQFNSRKPTVPRAAFGRAGRGTRDVFFLKTTGTLLRLPHADTRA